MRLLRPLLFLLAGLFPAGAAAQEVTIGIAAPLSGPLELLGRQLVSGARAAADAQGAGAVAADDACTAEGGAEAARRLAAEKVLAVVGFLCTESIEAALPILKEAGIPVLTPGIRTGSLTDRRDKTGWPVFRTAPRGDGEQRAVAELLVPAWRDVLFAIVDDGTIYGRELAESLRLAAEEAKLEPVFVDTFRPQLDNQIGLAGRLRKAGATHVFVGGDRDDIAILSRDAAGLGLALTVAGGEALRNAPGEVPLAPGTLMVGLPEWADVADPGIVAALRRKSIVPEGYVLPAYAAAEVAIAAGRQRQSGDPRSVAAILDNLSFDTALGQMVFDDKGDLAQNPYRLFRFDGGTFVPVADEPQE